MSILLTALWMIWKTWKSAKNDYFKSWAVCMLAACSSFMIAALFSDTTFGPQAIVFYTILAMITIVWNTNNEQSISGNFAAEPEEHSSMG